MATKLKETLESRETVRARLLELRRQIAEKRGLREVLGKALVEAEAECKREHAKLVELTSAASKLLHADLAGLSSTELSVQSSEPTRAD